MTRSNLNDSFKYALNGIIKSVNKERNIKIQILMMIIVIIAGVYFKINTCESFCCIILFGMVIGAELFNTAIENTVDFIEKNRNDNTDIIDKNAELAKDASAGAVLVLSISSAVIGLMIFIPKILMLL